VTRNLLDNFPSRKCLMKSFYMLENVLENSGPVVQCVFGFFRTLL
jgi:hypothetical protein